METALEILKGIPEDVIAHRFGDYVFIHLPAEIELYDPQLWLLLMVRDPAAHGPPAAADAVHVVLSDSSILELTYGELAAELKSQNEYRALLELPPLPDPATIMHESPATASQSTTPAAEEGE